MPDEKDGRAGNGVPVRDEKGACERGVNAAAGTRPDVATPVGGAGEGMYPDEGASQAGGRSDARVADADERSFVPSRGWRFGVWLVLGFTFFAVDQVTKAFMQALLVAPGVVGIQFIPGVLDFELVHNYGAAFGIGQGMGLAAVALAVVVIAFTVAYFLRARWMSRLEVVGLGLVMGGALGNALDRLVHGFVVDFIAVEFIDFPVFNVADICIVVGVCLAFLGFAVLSPANAHVHDAADHMAEGKPDVSDRTPVRKDGRDSAASGRGGKGGAR